MTVKRKKNAAAVALGMRSGISMTPEQRSERGRQAAFARYRKAKPPAPPPPGRWFGLVLIPEDPAPAKPGEPGYRGNTGAGLKRLDMAHANPQIILWSKNRAEVLARQRQEPRWTEILDLDYDPTRFTIQREYKPDVDAQLKALRTILDDSGGRS